MREYKFRGKRLDNGEWVYGYYVFDAAQNIHQICTNHKGSCNASYDYLHEVYLVDPATVGQLTGLHDEDGVEIYEGDIMEFDAYGSHYIGVVKIHKGNTGIHCKDATPLLDNAVKEQDAVVIGDIHENPELIKIKP